MSSSPSAREALLWHLSGEEQLKERLLQPPCSSLQLFCGTSESTTSTLTGSSLEPEVGQQLVRVSINAYGSWRFVTMEQHVAIVGFIVRGMVAGCGLALCQVQVYGKQDLTIFKARWPSTTLQVFVDDFLVQAEGKTRGEVLAKLVPPSEELLVTIVSSFGCEVSVPKADTIASDQELGASLNRCLGKLRGKGCSSVANLGIDFAAGAKRKAYWKTSIRKRRMQHLALRCKMLARLNKATRLKAGKKIFGNGLFAAASYGHEVHGASDEDDFHLRRVAASAFGLLGRGRCLAVASCLVDEYSWRATAGPILQWCKEVWWATTVPHTTASRHFALRKLAQHWGDFAASWPDKWVDVKGPVSAAYLSLLRLGWSWPEPFKLVDQNGTSRAITNHSPKELGIHVKEAYRCRLEKLAAAKMVGVSRCYWQHVKSFLRNKNLSLEKGCLSAFVVGSIWTQARNHRRPGQLPCLPLLWC